MPRCCVKGCKPPAGKKPKLHRFPQESENDRLDAWRRNAKISADEKDPRICELHFTEDQFEVDRKAQLLNNTIVMVLKPNAEPTVFPDSKEVKKRQSAEQIHQKKAKKACVEEAVATYSKNVIDDIEARSKNIQVSVVASDIGEQVRPDTRSIAIQCNITPHFRSAETQFSPVMIDQGAETDAPNILESTICDEEDEQPLLSIDQSTLVSNADDVTYSPQDDGSDKSAEADPPPYTAFVVFWSALSVLLKRCVQCRDSSSIKSYFFNGSMIGVHLSCSSGHQWTWKSQPTDTNRQAEGNLRLAAGILFSGNVFGRIAELFQYSSIRFLGKDTFYRFQKKYLYPVVNERWLQWTKSKISSLISGGKCKVCGDARCDSPGHNAKYSTYTFQDQATNEIIDFNVMQVTEAGNSNRMEKESFVKLLEKIEKQGVKVEQVTTDRHPSVRKYMREKRKDISYQYDVWHVAKSIFKKLLKASKKAACKSLEPWITSIRNHFWWSCATCDGDIEVLKEKWLSILHHIKNKHSWDAGKKYKKCCHKRLTKKQTQSKPWLKDGTEAYKALQSIVAEKKLLTDLEHVTKYSHTGDLEVYHALVIKYLPKRQHFHYRGMVCRTQLAAMDHNAGVNLPQAKTKKGVPRYKIVFPKLTSRWTAKPIKAHKNKSYILAMVDRAVECCNNNVELPNSVIPEIPKNIATTPRPDKKKVIEDHCSRFASSD